MSAVFILQVIVNLILGLGVYIIWQRMKRPPQEDPRLSKGLQLLQSKISILEDLSDRTDRQVHQIIQILEQKSIQFQKKVDDSNVQLQKINQAMHKSQELAKIFQDKIPHQEIIERQNTIKYIKAARMAHQGATPEDINLALGIPSSEAEFISKVNKKQLMFDENQLPEWARSELNSPVEENQFPNTQTVNQLNLQNESLIKNFKDKESTLKEIGDKFREACTDFETQQSELPSEEELLSPHTIVKNTLHSAESVRSTIADQAKKMAEKAPGLSLEKILEASKKRKSKSYQIIRNAGVEKAEFPVLQKNDIQNNGAKQ